MIIEKNIFLLIFNIVTSSLRVRLLHVMYLLLIMECTHFTYISFPLTTTTTTTQRQPIISGYLRHSPRRYCIAFDVLVFVVRLLRRLVVCFSHIFLNVCFPSIATKMLLLHMLNCNFSYPFGDHQYKSKYFWL